MLERPSLDDPTNTRAAPRWIHGEELLRTELEWLEADGLGGFASGTPCGLATRRYHGLLCVATTTPTGRRMLVKDLEAWIEVGGRSFRIRLGDDAHLCLVQDRGDQIYVRLGLRAP